MPTVGSLRSEIDRGAKIDGSSALMKPFVDVLDAFVKKVIQDDKKSKAAEQKETNQDPDDLF